MVTAAAPRLVRLSLALAIAAFVLALPVGSRAQSIPRLESAVTDETGLLSADRAAIEDALEQLFQETGVQLYVLFVDTTGGIDIGDYARLVGEQSLSPNDALLVVAVDDRADNLSVGSELAGRVSQTSLDRVRTQTLEPALAEGDFAGGVIRSAQALGSVLPGTGPTDPTPGTPGGSGTNFGSVVLAIVGVILIALGVLWLIGRVRTVREQRQRAFEEAKTQEALGREANKRLIATDDALRDAEQELGFAEAQFGAAAAGTLRQALASAKEELNAAFAIGQELDDTVPEPPEKRRQMIQDIIARCERAQAVASAQTAELARLREMERNAPQLLASLRAKASELEQRLADGPATQARLSRFAESNSAAVAGNFDAARSKQVSAIEALDAADALLQAGKTSEAVGTATSAEPLVHDATSLLDAVEHMANTLESTADKLGAELDAARGDVAAARQQLAGGSAQSLSDALRDAETALSEAEAAAAQTPPDVMNAFRRATDANALADNVLSGVREEQLRAQRLQQTAVSSVASAQASVVRARDYIDSHRRTQSIGRMARNRLVQAEAELDQARAILQSDAGRALQLARSADSLADEAYALAQQSTPGYDPVDVGRYRPDTDLGSLIIGAILGGMMSGGNRGGGGWSSGPSSTRGRRRGGGWFGGGGGWSGRSSSGGFGGFGSGGFGSGGFGSGGFGSGGFGGGRSSGGFGGGRSSSGRW